MKKTMWNKKGQLGSLAPAALALLVLAVVVSVVYIVLNNFLEATTTQLTGGDNTSGCLGNGSFTTDVTTANAICNMTSALNDNLTGNLGIIVIVVVFSVILGLIAFFRTQS